MAAMIISVGFSVDIPAHVSYHYHSAGFHGEVGVKERLRATLASVGFPAVQVRGGDKASNPSLQFFKQ